MTSSVNQCTQPAWRKQGRFQAIARGPCIETVLWKDVFHPQKKGWGHLFQPDLRQGWFQCHRAHLHWLGTRSLFGNVTWSSQCSQQPPPSGDTGDIGRHCCKTPLLSWHNWASSFPVNSSRCLRCKLQSAYPPKRCYCMCMHQADWSHPTEDLQGRGAAWGKSSVDLIPLGTTEHRGPSWEGGGELLITSSFLEVFRALLKTMCIWKYFVYKGTTETLG